MANALRIIGAVWVLPMTVIMWVLYLLPLWAFGRVSYGGGAGFLVVRYHVVQDGGLYARLWTNWGGFAMPHAIIINPPAGVQTELHELRHTDQWLALGPLFPVVYLVFLATMGYRDNLLEADARAWAAQQIRKAA